MNTQDGIVSFLSRPSAWPGDVRAVERIETHISWVFLAGRRAWKMKKALKLPYLDFSTLEKRHAMCRRELEINRRFSPALYLGLSRVTKAPDGALAVDGEGETMEWLVRMRRFDPDDIFSEIVRRGPLGAPVTRALAQTVAQSHERAVIHNRAHGARIMRRVLDELSAALLAREEALGREETRALLARLEALLATHAPLLERRARAGFVRRCHGDLHLGNIVLVDDRPMLFDALEFSEELATIDILYDLAFLLMDLIHRGRRDTASRVFNAWLQFSADEANYAGAGLMGLFCACRAAIRAMVLMDLAEQKSGAERTAKEDEARAYLRTALSCAREQRPRVIAVGGFSGSGKTTLAAALAARVGAGPGAVHLRTDVERKRMAGVDEFTRLGPEHYTQAASDAVYESLLEKAKAVAASGWPVVVDAVFSKESERAAFSRMARRAGVDFAGIWLSAPRDVLRQRVAGRTGDASDATPAVVDLQLERGAGDIGWRTVNAAGSPREVLDAALEALGQEK